MVMETKPVVQVPTTQLPNLPPPPQTKVDYLTDC